MRAELADETDRLTGLRDRLESRLRAGVPGLVVHGHPTERLLNTLSVALPGVHAHRLLERLGDRVAASPGSACHADKVQVSHVLSAMGVEPALALSTIRLSVGRFTTEGEVDRAAELILAEVAGTRPSAGFQR